MASSWWKCYVLLINPSRYTCTGADLFSLQNALEQLFPSSKLHQYVTYAHIVCVLARERRGSDIPHSVLNPPYPAHSTWSRLDFDALFRYLVMWPVGKSHCAYVRFGICHLMTPEFIFVLPAYGWESTQCLPTSGSAWCNLVWKWCGCFERVYQEV